MAAAAGSHKRILIALVAGAAVGSLVNYAVREGHLDKAAVEKFIKYTTKPIGQIFINLLYLAIIPLIFASLAVGVSRLGGSANAGRVGLRTIAYFIITTVFAAIIGLTLVNVIRPGDMDDDIKRELKSEFADKAVEAGRKPAAFGIDTFVAVFTKNPLKAFTDQEMLAVIFVSLLVGVALTKIEPARAKTLIDVLDAVNAVTDYIIRTAMRLAPIGVFALLFTTSALFGDKLLRALAWFMITVLAGLALQMFVVFPPLVKFLGGMNPIDFFVKSRDPMITAFSTSSSSATLPTAIKCAEEELRVPPSIARFVLPLSASMNHNGTALFEAVTAVFLCQVFGVNLGLDQQLVLVLLCVLTATGMAGVPGGSIPLIGMIVASIAPEVPAAAIGIVIGVDRLLDMCRTMVNVTGDMSTVVFVARSERGQAAGAEPPAAAP